MGTVRVRQLPAGCLSFPFPRGKEMTASGMMQDIGAGVDGQSLRGLGCERGGRHNFGVAKGS